MKRKISTDIFLTQWIFLIVILICGACFYKVLFPFYYEWIKDRQIQEAYLDIKDLDLANMEDSDYIVFAEYEGENLSFTIADENMNPIYVTSENEKYLVYRNIETKLDSFSKEPKIIKRNSKLRETIKLRGIVTQDEVDYYVVIKDLALRHEAMKIIEQFLLILVILLILVGTLVLLKHSGGVSKPFQQLIIVSDKIAAESFSERAEEEGKYEEINKLARNINLMAEQLQEKKGQINESRRQILNQNVRQERVEKIRKDFVANISHELKTPLAVISSQTEMLAYAEDADRDYYLSSIQEEVIKMSDMVSELLNLSVVEHHVKSMVQKTLDMKEVLEYILLKYEGLIKKKMLHMEVFLEEECFVYGDREYIEQAVNNYMMNACEHTELGGNIRVTLKRQESDIRVGVYNTGKQIPEEAMTHIWKEFYTKKQKEEDLFSNAGLGLSIVQSVVAMQDGQCGVENVSEGVEFWFTLPGIEKEEKDLV